MSSIKSPKASIRHMLDAVDAIQGISHDKYGDYYYMRALERDLSIIGEAANRLSENFQAQYPAIPWRQIIDLRHVIVHGYDKISTASLLDIVTHQLPSLKSELEAIWEKVKHD